MDLTQLANLGEFIGGVAVLVTLVYLAAQIRQNTRSVQASVVDSLVGLEAFSDSRIAALATSIRSLRSPIAYRLSGNSRLPHRRRRDVVGASRSARITHSPATMGA
jgi:hypothetical protein